MIGIIGGSGFYELAEDQEEQRIETPFGDVVVYKGVLFGKEIIFLPRHGIKHSIPPTKINYFANIFALRKIGVSEVISTTACGAISRRPGELVILSDFIDLTTDRKKTFYDGEFSAIFDGKKYEGVKHANMVPPFCPRLREELISVASREMIDIVPFGIYATMEGNRYETPAEIRMLRLLGADCVGMTLSPEAALARELEMCYASIGVMTNYAAGITEEPLSHEEVIEMFSRKIDLVKRIIREFVRNHQVGKECPYCRWLHK
ncbi:MAG: MTAP family purine nucleoside phosphorylase [Candidatus Korarchaeota archaeon]